MSSRGLLVAAIILLFGAGVAGYWGVALSTPPVEDPQLSAEVTAPAETPPAAQLVSDAVQRAEESRLVNVVTLARDVSANVPLTSEDLLVQRLQLAPPDSLDNEELVLGRALWRDLPAGTVLAESSFGSGGSLAHMIRRNERAVTLAVDEIVGAGGHLRPGDYVDVLLFLRRDELNIEPTAQMVVPALRVLSVGEELGLSLDGTPVVPVVPEEENTNQRQNTRREIARSAVLAVPAPLVSRLTLAAQVGELRLVVRSAEEELLADFYGEGTAINQILIGEIDQQLFRFQKLALNGAAAPESQAAQQLPRSVEIIRGTAVSSDTP